MTLARRLLLVLLGLALGAGAFVCRCYSLRDTFIDGRIYFVDDDCYSRMTRVREIAQHPGTIIRHHSFENFPYGVHSHASAPFDYLIFFLKRLLDFCFAHSSAGRTSLLAAQTGDLAGALVSPLLGALTTVFLGYWGWRMTSQTLSGDNPKKGFAGLRWCAALAPALLFAVSPILADGTQLGRPDHQSLLMALLTVALAGEAMLWTRRPSPDLIGEKGRGRWGAATGVAWGMALWVSLYEPSILLLATAVFLLSFARTSLRSRARLWEGGCILALLAAALLVEGWPFDALPPEVARYFPAWSKTISELRHLSPWDPSFPQGLGWLCLAAPLLLGAAAVLQDQRAWIWLLLGLLTFALTCWQIRWFYYFGLVFCLSLPWQIAAMRRVWIAAPLFLLALYPVAQAWEAALFPDDASSDKAISQRRERVLLRDAAQHLQGDWPQPFIATYWASPPLAYWSGQPGIAGSSHESLPGIVAAARLFLDPLDPAHPIAPAILRERQVAYVVVDEAERMTGPAATLLGFRPTPNCLAFQLNENPNGAVPYLLPVYTNLFFKVFAVDVNRLGP